MPAHAPRADADRSAVDPLLATGAPHAARAPHLVRAALYGNKLFCLIFCVVLIFLCCALVFSFLIYNYYDYYYCLLLVAATTGKEEASVEFFARGKSLVLSNTGFANYRYAQ